MVLHYYKELANLIKVQLQKKEQDIVDLYRGFVDSNDAIFLDYGFQIEMPSFPTKTRNNIPCKKPFV